MIKTALLLLLTLTLCSCGGELIEVKIIQVVEQHAEGSGLGKVHWRRHVIIERTDNLRRGSIRGFLGEEGEVFTVSTSSVTWR